MTALPIAWLALLAALQDRDDYDHQLAASRSWSRRIPWAS